LHFVVNDYTSLMGAKGGTQINEWLEMQYDFWLLRLRTPASEIFQATVKLFAVALRINGSAGRVIKVAFEEVVGNVN